MEKTKLELFKELIAELTENKKAYEAIEQHAWKTCEAKEIDIIANYKQLFKDVKEQNE